MLEKVRVRLPVGRPRTRPGAVAGDKAYSSRGNRSYLRRRGIQAVIPEKKDQAANRRKKGARGGRPISHDADLCKERNTVERLINKLRILARTADGDPAGFTYGLPLSSSTSWWDGFLDATPAAEFTREDGRRTFVLKELAVLADQRRHGIGRELHQHLLHGITADRATLTVRPEAPAAAWYERLGYTLVGHTQPWDSAPMYRTLLKPLRASRVHG